MERGELSPTTLRNYIKAIKLFCEMNDIAVSWKKITMGLPKARRFADDTQTSEVIFYRQLQVYDYKTGVHWIGHEWTLKDKSGGPTSFLWLVYTEFKAS